MNSSLEVEALASRKKSDSQMDHDMLMMRGGALTEAEAAEREVLLGKEPEDLTSRLTLLGYYFLHQYSSRTIARKRLKCILWLVEHAPELVGSGPYMDIYLALDPAGYEKGKALWLKQVGRYPDRVAIISSAAKFFRSNDWRLSEKLSVLATSLEPENGDLYRDLASTLRIGARPNTERMRRALVAIKAAFSKTKDERSKYYLADDVAEIAYDTSEWSLAEKFARMCLKSAGEFMTDWNAGNAIHNGNCILGRLALRNGKMKKARQHLDAAGKTHGSPQLDSFGPNMRFAQDMLRAGEGKAVCSYLEDCKRFWEGKETVLSETIAKIKSGKKPRLPRIC